MESSGFPLVIIEHSVSLHKIIIHHNKKKGHSSEDSCHRDSDSILLHPHGRRTVSRFSSHSFFTSRLKYETFSLALTGSKIRARTALVPITKGLGLEFPFWLEIRMLQAWTELEGRKW